MCALTSSMLSPGLGHGCEAPRRGLQRWCNVAIVAAQELEGQKKAKLELLERHQSQLDALTRQETLLSKSLDSAIDTAKGKTLIDAKRRTRRRNTAVDLDEEYCELPKFPPVCCFSGATWLTC